MNNYKTSLKKASIITILGKYSSVLLNLIFTIILSRILSPIDFGYVAVIVIFTTFFTIVSEFGIGPAIIQNKNLTKNDLNSIFSLTIYIAVIICFIFAFISYPISILYSNEIYFSIGLLMTITLFFNTINIVPNALLLKNHNFLFSAIRNILVFILSSIPSIIFALLGFGYYAIISHSILLAFFSFIVNISKTKLLFKIKPKFKSFEKIRKYSFYQLMFTVVNYFSRNLDNILIGRFFNAESLGFYNRSYQLMIYPVSYLTHAISPAIHPVLSNHQNDKTYVYSSYKKVLKILSILGIYISTTSFFMAEEIILILFGSQWQNSIISFKLLSISIWFQMLTSSTGAIFQTLNDTKNLFISGLFSSIIIIFFITIGLTLGTINYVALFVSIAYIIISILISYILISKSFNFKFNKFLSIFKNDLIIFVIFIISNYFLSLVVINNIYLSLFIKGLIGIIIYMFTLFLFKEHKIILNIIKIGKKNERNT